MTAPRDLTNQRFGRLVAKSRAPGDERGRTRWTVVCDCGAELVVLTESLSGGKTQSCGCLQRERAAAAQFKHGASDKKHPQHAEFEIWKSMKQRCLNRETPGYANYGGRGIQVCERWFKSFSDFLADMGPRPSAQHSLDRINVDGNYEPGNCRWATRNEQNLNKRSNRRIEHEGLSLTIGEWADRKGLTFNAVRERLRKGWSVEAALTTPLRVQPPRVQPAKAVPAQPIRTTEIRAALHGLIDRTAPQGSVVVDEYGIAHVCVADVAVFRRDGLHLFEIKSDSDSTTRLGSQSNFYSECGPVACTLVVGPRLLAKAVAIIPRWWGVLVARRPKDGAVVLERVSHSSENPQASLSVLSALWANEAWEALKELGISRGKSREGRNAWLWALSEHLDVARRRELVFEKVCKRKWMESRTPVRLVPAREVA